jgi:hypothetical protein
LAKKKRPLPHRVGEAARDDDAALLGPDSHARKPPAAKSEAEGGGKEKGAVRHERRNTK